MKEDYLEINKKAYDALAKEYEKRTIDNDYEIKDDFWLEVLSNIIKKEKTQVLEIGPGSGRNLKIFELLKCETTAVELSSEMSKVAKKWSPNSNIITGNILECSFPQNKFDIIFCAAVIHNFPVHDAKKLLEKVNLWLKKDGFLVIATTIHEKENSGILIKEDYNQKIGRFRHQYTKETFEKLIESNHFTIYHQKIVEETDRNKKWYLLICNKNKKNTVN